MRIRCNTARRIKLAFIPWFPVAAGKLAQPGGALDETARMHHATVAQLALAWLLHRSKVMLPIPGTSSVAHLEENVGAAELKLDARRVECIGARSGESPCMSAYKPHGWRRSR